MPETRVPRSLTELIIEAGHRPSPGITDATRLAAAAQRGRQFADESTRTGVTRSTLLWALMTVDTAVNAALTRSGVNRADLAGILAIDEAGKLPAREDAEPEPELARAVVDYLNQLAPDSDVGTPSLSWAIVFSAQNQSGGALPRRLEKLGIDYQAAFAALEGIGAINPFGPKVAGPGPKQAKGSDSEATGPRPEPEVSDKTGWVHDGLAEKDMLGRDYLATTLAMKLRELREMRTGTSPKGESFMVHIDGPWGSGKSTLFRFLRKQLEATDDFLIIEINAWREQKVGLQWWTLHNALREAVEKDAIRLSHWTALAWVRAKATSRAHVIQTRLVPFLSAVAVLTVGLFGLTLLANLDLKAGAEMADSIGKIASLLVLGVAGLSAAYRFLLPDSHRPAKDFVSAATNPMVEVRRLFGRTLGRTKKSAVFLIDDLDRCEPEYIVDFLSVIQTLVRDARQTVAGPASKAPPPGPYAFVAADGHWIRTSYEAHYNSARPAEVLGRPLGYQFLEKIFQLQVRLPSISEATKQAFYESLLKLQPGSDATAEGQENLKAEVLSRVRDAATGEDISRAAAGANQLTDAALRLEVLGTAAVRFSESLIQESTRHALAPYGRFLEPNPRSIKLFVNTYNVLRSLRILEGLTSIPIRSLALWAVLEIRWPLLADHLRAHPDDISLKGSTALKPPKPIQDLLGSAEVKAVIADPGLGPLTSNDIRDCTGRAASRP
ncbi:P-loop NTPase fold protein [Arthrobacter sp. 754]|uniref:KAP family P-loop NTPase fold protein n=1 Tax=Arthrobacter sp. 754 TaxID=3156315 RepID=UPI00339980A1